MTFYNFTFTHADVLMDVSMTLIFTATALYPLSINPYSGFKLHQVVLTGKNIHSDRETRINISNNRPNTYTDTNPLGKQCR